jgi:hypothetical protein
MQTTSTAVYYDADSFLDAWLRGVEIAGIEWFGNAWSDKTSPTKWDYRPDFDLIEGNIGVLSTGEAAFLAAMYSFFNPDTGAQMMRDLGFGSPGAVAAVMDEPRRRVIADLLVSYDGW